MVNELYIISCICTQKCFPPRRIISSACETLCSLHECSGARPAWIHGVSASNRPPLFFECKTFNESLCNNLSVLEPLSLSTWHAGALKSSKAKRCCYTAKVFLWFSVAEVVGLSGKLHFILLYVYLQIKDCNPFYFQIHPDSLFIVVKVGSYTLSQLKFTNLTHAEFQSFVYCLCC